MLFEVLTPLSFRVRVARSRWEEIVSNKHPSMKGRELHIQAALSQPHEVRRSRSDPRVYLFYRMERPDRWLCAVGKRLDGEGFLITAYPADTIKAGELLWRE